MMSDSVKGIGNPDFDRMVFIVDKVGCKWNIQVPKLYITIASQCNLETKWSNYAFLKRFSYLKAKNIMWVSLQISP